MYRKIFLRFYPVMFYILPVMIAQNVMLTGRTLARGVVGSTMYSILFNVYHKRCSWCYIHLNVFLSLHMHYYLG